MISFLNKHKISLKGLLILIVPCMSALNAFGQSISSSTPYFDTTKYAEDPQDMIYVFYKDSASVSDSLAEADLTAETGNDTINADFNWYRFDYNSNRFEPIPFSTQTGVPQTTVNTLPTGGYKVRISNGEGLDTNLLAWVFITYLNVYVVKDEEGNLGDGSKYCDRLDLEGHLSTNETFRYYDFVDSSVVNLTNEIEFEWTDDWSESGSNTEVDIINKRTSLRPRVQRPPYEDVSYILNVYDKYRYRSNPMTDQVFYESEVPKAMILDKGESDWSKFIEVFDSHYEADPVDPDNKGTSGDKMSAPVRATFTHSSKNAVKYTWKLVDSSKFAYDPNYIIETTDPDTMIEYTYYIPRGETTPYKVNLFAESEEGCQDSLENTGEIPEIFVIYSKIKAPNIVCPDCPAEGENEDGYYFRLENESLRTIRVRIFDRWGKKVHEYEGDIDMWNNGRGWDGTKGNGRKASQGLYFYYIEARGWDSRQMELPGDEQKEPQQAGVEPTPGAGGMAKGAFYLVWKEQKGKLTE